MFSKMSIELVLLLLLLGMSAFFSGAETALTSLSKHQLLHLKKRKVRGIKCVLYLRENPGVMLATILMGNNLVNISISSLATLIVMRVMQQWMITSELYITGVTTFITTMVVLIFGEITPKTVAMVQARRIALFTAPIIVFLSYIFKPLVWLFNKISTVCIALLGGQKLEKNSLVTEEEILSLVEAGQETGAIEKAERKMIHDVIRFGDTLVGEVMTPLDNVVALEDKLTIQDVMRKIKTRVHSRLPVYSGTKKNILGLLYIKDLIFSVYTIKSPDTVCIKDLPNLIRKPVVVYIDQKTTEVLNQLRFHKVHIAVVKNRDDKTVGLVTIEDLIEEIVGDIADEYEVV